MCDNKRMKIINPNKKNRSKRTLTLRIDESVMTEVDKLSKKSGLSRQRLVEAILQQVIDDKDFVLDLSDSKDKSA